VLCTGFVGSVAAAATHLFEFADDQHPRKGCLGSAPLLTEDDESTKTPGIFLVGTSVHHDKLSFCFVYKFRQRFTLVANAICQGLEIDTKTAIADCRSVNMYLDDFARCEDTCGDVC
jgi:putative flavoprotein involved in K+ transport